MKGAHRALKGAYPKEEVMDHPDTSLPRVVIVGGGFAGLAAAKKLTKAPVGVTLIDKRNFHLFQPLLYQVATGGLSPANITTPFRGFLKNQKRVLILMGEVLDVDFQARKVITEQEAISYDFLILALGSRTSYFSHGDWAERAPGLKTIEDAVRIRNTLLRSFEEAEHLENQEAQRPWLSFVVVGAGPTGVELAGALSELAHGTLRGNFKRFDLSQVRVILIEAKDQVLPGGFPPSLQEAAKRALKSLHVEVITQAMVETIEEGSLTLNKDGTKQTIQAKTILWTAGIQALSLAGVIAKKAGVELVKGKAIPTNPDLSLPGHPEVFILGDLALVKDSDGKPLPQLASVATQEGKYVADLIQKRIEGKKSKPFKFRNLGTMVTIGRKKAVAQVLKIKLRGYPAWLVWLFVHLMNLVQFENRMLVFVQWAWSYLTRNRSARLITEPGKPPPYEGSLHADNLSGPHR